MLKKRFVPVLFLAVSMVACGGQGKSGTDEAKSMEQIHSEEGVPVSVRPLDEKDFSVYLKYPTVLRSRAESTAYAGLSDVVRSVPVKIGDRVARDQIVITFSLDNPQYQQARLAYENAKSSFERSNALFADAGMSKQDFDNIRTQYEIARATFKQIADAVEAKAPIDGFVTRINVRPTENVRPGDALFTVSNQDGFETRFYVTSEEIDSVKVGSRARISTSDGEAEGSVVEVSLIMDSERKAFPATAFFAGKTRGLVSGMSLDVAVESYRNEHAIVVERKELVRSGEAWMAYVSTSDGKAHRRDVVVGRERGLELEIVGGLRAGESLISSGAQNVLDGASIKVVETIAKR